MYAGIKIMPLHRDLDADDDHQWESNWRNASASSSEGDTDSPPTQETTSMRPKRAKRPTLRDDDDVVQSYLFDDLHPCHSPKPAIQAQHKETPNCTAHASCTEIH